jgi:lysophospholipase L1-like esterase
VIARIGTAAALAATLGLAACSGGGGSQALGTPPFTVSPGSTAAAQVRIVGVGDSLTAGTQSGGTVGADIPGGETAPGVGTIGRVQETQEHGFFALIWEQANGVTQTTLENPATSPLPLIAPLGIGGILAKTSSGFPAGLTAPCQGQRLAAFSPSGALSDRLNPQITPYDLGVPGMTVHEALAMFQPISSCVAPADAATLAQTASGRALLGLNQLVAGESEDFYPVLANFGAKVTPIQAAVSLHANLATVYLGSNDLLHFAFANGGSPPASPAAIGADIATMIGQLQAGGAKVAVGNLVDVLGAATFFPVQSSTEPNYEQNLDGFLQAAIIAQAVQQFGITPAQAAANPAVQQQIALSYQAAHQYAQAEIAQTQLGPAGYFLLPVLLETVAAILQQQPVPQLITPSNPTGAGEIVSDQVALTVKSLNAAYNQAIAGAVQQTGAVLADQAALFQTAETQRAAGQPFAVDAQGDFASLEYGGGFFSLDGLHPSNTGYALIANTFIAAFDQKYGLTIPPVDVHSVYANDPYSAGNFSTINPSSYVRATR